VPTMLKVLVGCFETFLLTNLASSSSFQSSVSCHAVSAAQTLSKKSSKVQLVSFPGLGKSDLLLIQVWYQSIHALNLLESLTSSEFQALFTSPFLLSLSPDFRSFFQITSEFKSLKSLNRLLCQRTTLTSTSNQS